MLSLSPGGVELAGGVQLTVTAAGLLPPTYYDGLTCVFVELNTTLSEASCVDFGLSLSALSARAPRIATTTAVQASDDDQSVTCATPAWTENATSVVTLSVDGSSLLPAATLSCTQLSFSFYDAAQMQTGMSISPSCGPIEGGTTTRVSAPGLKDLGGLRCRFNSSTTSRLLTSGSLAVAVMSATMATDAAETLECAAPSASQVGTVEISISLTGDAGPWYTPTYHGNNFVYYNQPTISSVEPTSSSAGIPTTLTLSGSGFQGGCAASTTPVCRLGTDSSAWETSTNLTILSDDMASCLSPVGTGVAEVQLSLNGADFAASNESVSHTFVGLYSPRLNSATFSSSGSRLLLDFGAQATNMAGNALGAIQSCNGVLSDATIALLSNEIQCQWPSRTLLEVLLWGGARPVPGIGDVVELANGTIAPQGSTDSSLFAYGVSATLQAASNSEVPTARASVPATVNECSAELRLDGSPSSTTSVFPLLYLWQVTLDSDNAAEINQRLLDLYNADPYQSITRLAVSYLIGASFTFQLQVTTNTGANSQFVEASTVKEAEAPSVSINGPSSVLKSEAMTLEPSVSVCDSALTTVLAWQWTLSAANGASFGSALSGAALQQRSLLVPAGELPSNTAVTFQVDASDGERQGTSSLSVAVSATPLVGAIIGGARVSRGTTETIEVDASASNDPDDVGASLVYNWECTLAHPTGNASTATPDVCTGVADAAVTLQDATAAKASIQPNTLNAGWDYTFTVTVIAVDGRSASTSIIVAVEDIIPPQVNIGLGSSSASNIAKVSADEVLRLRGAVTSADGAAYSYSYAWSVLVPSTGECILTAGSCASVQSLCDASSSSSLQQMQTADLTALNLVLAASSQSLTAGATYTFALSATVNQDECGFATLDVTVNAPPFGGSLGVVPSSGVALNTTFALTAPGWVDDADDLPLTYSYYHALSGVRAASGSSASVPSDALPLVLTGYFAAVDTTVPLTGEREVFVRVVDKYQSAALSTAANVSVVWAVATETVEQKTDLATSLVNSDLASAETLQDAAQVQAVVSSAAKLLTEAVDQQSQEVISTEDEESSRANRTKLRTSLIQGLELSTSSSASSGFIVAQAQLVNEVTVASDELEDTARLQAANLVGTLAAQLNSAASGSLEAPTALASTLSNVLSDSGVEGDAVGSSSRRRRRRLETSSTNNSALVDSVVSAVGSISEALVSGAVAGESFTVSAANLALRSARYEDAAALANLTLSVTADGNNATSSGSWVSLAGLSSENISATAENVDVQLVNYAINPRAYASSANSLCWDDDASCSPGTASNMTTLSLRQGSTTLDVSNLSKPILISFAVVTPENMSGSGGTCDPDPGKECREGANATEEALAAERSRCDDVGEARVWGFASVEREWRKCNSTLEELSANLSMYEAMCEQLPVQCSGRGNCSVDGLCECDTGWMGDQCDVEYECRYWDVDLDEWSTEGCELTEQNGNTVTCGCTHLTSFGTFAKTVLSDGGFSSISLDITTIDLQLPFLSWSELLGAFETMGVGGWLLFVFGYLGMLAAVLALHRKDERGVHKTFMPVWHRFLSRRDSDSRVDKARRVISLVLLWFLVSHYLFVPFFLLPWESQTRAQAACTAFAILLGEINLLCLFWSTYKAFGNEWTDEPPSATHAFWSLLLHQLVGLVTQKVFAKVFGMGVNRKQPVSLKFFTRTVDVAFTKEDARKRTEVTIDHLGKVNEHEVNWNSDQPRVGTYRIVEVEADNIGAAVKLSGGKKGSATQVYTFENVSSKAEVDDEEGLAQVVKHVLEESTGWKLLFRQTAPRRWQREVDTLHQWDPTSPNYAQLDPMVIDDLRDENGALTLRLLWWEPGDKDGSDMDVWRQTSDPLQPCRRVEGFEPLLTKHKGETKSGGRAAFGGLRGSKSQRYHLSQGAISGSDALYVIGQQRMNQWGGLTTWQLDQKSTRWRVELYGLMPQSETARGLQNAIEAVDASTESPDNKLPSPTRRGVMAFAKHARNSVVALTGSKTAQDNQKDSAKQLQEELGLGKLRLKIERQFMAHKIGFKLKQFVTSWYNELFADPEYKYNDRNAKDEREDQPWWRCWGSPKRASTDGTTRLASVEIQPSQLILQEGPGHLGFFVQDGVSCRYVPVLRIYRRVARCDVRGELARCCGCNWFRSTYTQFFAEYREIDAQEPVASVYPDVQISLDETSSSIVVGQGASGRMSIVMTTEARPEPPANTPRVADSDEVETPQPSPPPSPPAPAEVPALADAPAPAEAPATAELSAAAERPVSMSEACKASAEDQKSVEVLASRDSALSVEGPSGMGPITPNDVLEYPLMVHEQIAAFLYSAVAEEGISEPIARDELELVCSGLPPDYAWRSPGTLWAPAYVQPRIWIAWAINLTILFLLELLLATFVVKLRNMFDAGTFCSAFFGFILLDPIKDEVFGAFGKVGKAVAATAILLIVLGETPGGRKVQWWTQQRAHILRLRLKRAQDWVQLKLGGQGKTSEEARRRLTVASKEKPQNFSFASARQLVKLSGDWLEQRIGEVKNWTTAPRGSKATSLKRTTSRAPSTTSLRPATLATDDTLEAAPAKPRVTFEARASAFISLRPGAPAEAEAAAPGTERDARPAYERGSSIAETRTTGRRTSIAKSRGNRGSVTGQTNARRSIVLAMQSPSLHAGAAEDQGTLSPDEDEGTDSTRSSGAVPAGEISIASAAKALQSYHMLRRRVKERRHATDVRFGQRRVAFQQGLQQAVTGRNARVRQVAATKVQAAVRGRKARAEARATLTSRRQQADTFVLDVGFVARLQARSQAAKAEAAKAASRAAEAAAAVQLNRATGASAAAAAAKAARERIDAQKLAAAEAEALLAAAIKAAEEEAAAEAAARAEEAEQAQIAAAVAQELAESAIALVLEAKAAASAAVGVALAPPTFVARLKRRASAAADAASAARVADQAAAAKEAVLAAELALLAAEEQRRQHYAATKVAKHVRGRAARKIAQRRRVMEEAAMRARLLAGGDSGLSEEAMTRLQGVLDFTRSAIPSTNVAVRKMEIRLQKSREAASSSGDIEARGALLERRLEPSDLQERAEQWVERQLDFSFMTGAGADEVRKLLKAVQEGQKLGAISALPEEPAAQKANQQNDALQMSQLYLSCLQKLANLECRSDWIYEQLEELKNRPPPPAPQDTVAPKPQQAAVPSQGITAVSRNVLLSKRFRPVVRRTIHTSYS